MKKVLSNPIIFIFSFYILHGQKISASRYKFSDSILSHPSSYILQEKQISEFGVEISFIVNEKMFPTSMLTPGMNGKATPLDSVDFEKSKQIIVKALNKYPIEIIKRNLTKVYIVKELEFFGLKYGGTYHNSIIYIVRGHNDLWLEQAFHHEFSSILFNNYSFLFNQKKWISNNKDIHYGNGGFEALKQGKTSKLFDINLNKKGILSEYGTASIEEDFNLFAENLFFNSPKFWEIERTQKRIARKVNLVVLFYTQIDSISAIPNQIKRELLTEFEAKKLADSLFTILMNGMDFKKMVKLYSEDQGSIKQDGKYTNIKKGQMTSEFENAFLNLKLNEISKPFRTAYGYDIVQLLNKQGERYTVRHILIKFKE